LIPFFSTTGMAEFRSSMKCFTKEWVDNGL
jgi:hypothetical protein